MNVEPSVENTNSCTPVPTPPDEIVPVAPPDPVSASPATISDPDPASTVGPTNIILLPPSVFTA